MFDNLFSGLDLQRFVRPMAFHDSTFPLTPSPTPSSSHEHFIARTLHRTNTSLQGHLIGRTPRERDARCPITNHRLEVAPWQNPQPFPPVRHRFIRLRDRYPTTQSQDGRPLAHISSKGYRTTVSAPCLAFRETSSCSSTACCKTARWMLWG